MRTLFDDEDKTYMVLDIGWQDNRYIHNTAIHIDIIGDKIWVQKDDTEDGVAGELLEGGIPRENIVLGFRHPEIRQYTGFATE